MLFHTDTHNVESRKMLNSQTNNKAFIDIKLRPGIATPPEED